MVLGRKKYEENIATRAVPPLQQATNFGGRFRGRAEAQECDYPPPEALGKALTSEGWVVGHSTIVLVIEVRQCGTTSGN